MSFAGEEFIEKTKYHNMGVSAQMQGAPAPELQTYWDKTKEVIALPDWNNNIISDKSIISAINNRQSIRDYSNKNLSLHELSYLLWCTQGVKEIIHNSVTLRTVPSAGARHALETFLLINRVGDLSVGIYRYLSLQHILGVVLKDYSIVDKIVEAGFAQDFIRHSAVTFIWVASIYRMKWRYGERAYRYIFLDAGHVAQNLYLAAEAIDCGVCVIAAFSDDDLNSILGLDGKEQFAIYMATVGKKMNYNKIH